MIILQNKPLILLVDDWPENLHIMVSALRSQYRVKTATDGEMALALAAKADRPDLIVLDLMMPVMDGFEVLQRLRHENQTCHIPVIMVTADQSVENERKGLELGVDDYLTKPVAVPILIARVQNLLSRKQAENQLRLFSQVVAQSHEGIVVTDVNSKIVFVNQAFLDINGYSEEELIGRTPNVLASGKHDPNLYEQMWISLIKDRHWQGEVWNKRKNGTIYPEWLSISAVVDENESIINYIGIATDISVRKKMEDELEFMAHHDVLTGLPNRAGLDVHLRMAMARARRHRQMLAVGILDIDNFKSVNDTYGHPAGDELLQTVATRVRSVLRGYDLLIRLGGDEFVIVIEELHSAADLDPIMNRLQQVMEVPILLHSNISLVEVQVEVSLGLVLFPEIEGEPDTLLREADQILYRIKALKGRRERWWAVSGEQLQETPGSKILRPYGNKAAELLSVNAEILEEIQQAMLETYQETIMVVAGSVDWLKRQASEYFALLFQPDLIESQHRFRANSLGRQHAAAGMNWLRIFGVYNDWMTLIQERLHTHRLSSSLMTIVMERLWIDAEEHAAGFGFIDDQRWQLINEINSMVWNSERFNDFAENMVSRLIRLDEVWAAAVGRPDDTGQFHYHWSAGTLLESLPLTVPVLEEGANTAWSTGNVQRIENYAIEKFTPWCNYLLDNKVLSSVAIPILHTSGKPHAVLILYGGHPGGFVAPAQQSLIEHLQTVFGILLTKLSIYEETTHLDNDHSLSVQQLESTVIMYYQPIINLHSGELIKVEALARLQGLDGQLIMPNNFLPLLTADGLRQLFELGLKQGFAALNDWKQKGIGCSLAVNLPPLGLMDSRYGGIVRTALQEYDLSPAHLVLELLETDRIDESSTFDMLQMFERMGVDLAQDDLGSGYSGLLRLKELPFHLVKVSQELIRGIEQNPLRVFKFVYGLTRLAHELGMQVVVEGLETIAHVEMAFILGADLGQGYGIAKPMASEQLITWVQSKRRLLQDDIVHTALGALAAYWRWVEDVEIFKMDENLLSRFVKKPCALGRYIETQNMLASKLDQAHQLIHHAALYHQWEDYHEAHQQVIAILTEQLQKERL